MAKPIRIEADIVQKRDAATKKIETDNFKSGSLGTGWRLEGNSSNGLGYLEVDNILVRNTLRTHIFQKDVIKATNGQLYVSDSGVVDSINTATSTIYFKKDKSATFSVNDQLKIKDVNDTGTVQTITFTIFSVGAEANGAKAYTYSAGVNMTAIQSGMTAVRVSGPAILLNATEDAVKGTPYIDAMQDGVTKVRIGSLNGVPEGTGYGLYGENVFLKGKITAQSGNIGGWVIENTGTELAPNYILKDSAGKIILDANTPKITIGDGGKLMVGDYGTNYMEWTGSALELKGKIGGEISEINVGNIKILGSSGIVARDSTNITTFSLDSNTGNVYLKGKIEAGSGSIGGWDINTGNLSTTGMTLDAANSKITVGTGIVIDGANSKITFGNTDYIQGNENFSLGNGNVSWNGTTLAVTGTINAKAGLIGSSATKKWTIGTNTTNASIYNGRSGYSAAQAGIYIGTDGIALGSATANAQFSVTSAGVLNATSATIKGEINATSGTFNNTITVGTHANKISIVGASTAAGTKIFAGTGTHGNSNTGFYLDARGYFSLGKELTWDNSSLSLVGDIGGTIGSINIGDTTNGIIINSIGITARKAGNTTFNLSSSGDASFTGVVHALEGGTIGGWTILSKILANSGNAASVLESNAGEFRVDQESTRHFKSQLNPRGLRSWEVNSSGNWINNTIQSHIGNNSIEFYKTTSDPSTSYVSSNNFLGSIRADVSGLRMTYKSVDMGFITIGDQSPGFSYSSYMSNGDVLHAAATDMTLRVGSSSFAYIDKKTTVLPEENTSYKIAVSSGGMSTRIIKDQIQALDIAKVDEFFDKIEPKQYKDLMKNKNKISVIIEDEEEKDLPYKDLIFKKEEKLIRYAVLPDFLLPYENDPDVITKETHSDGVYYYFNPKVLDEHSLRGIMIAGIKNNHIRTKKLERENKILNRKFMDLEHRLNLLQELILEKKEE